MANLPATPPRRHFSSGADYRVILICRLDELYLERRAWARKKPSCTAISISLNIYWHISRALRAEEGTPIFLPATLMACAPDAPFSGRSDVKQLS